MIWLLMLACSDPALDPIAEALAHNESGQVALASGDTKAAVEHFDRAAAAHPRSPALIGWQVHARVEAGAVDDALRVVEAGVGAHPDHAHLRYNRAALRARTGDLNGAAADLAWLYTRSLAEPAEAGADPDFAALAAHPEYARLVPAPSVLVEVEAEGGKVLRGDGWTLRLKVDAPRTGRLQITDLGLPSGLLGLRSVVEDVGAGSALRDRRELSIRWTAVAAGEAEKGPWRAQVGDTTTQFGPVSVAVAELGRAAEAGDALETRTLPIPSTLLGERVLPFQGAVEGWHMVAWREGSPPVRLDSPPDVVLEHREAEQTIWRGELRRR